MSVSDADSDAKEMIDSFEEQIIEQIIDNGEASDDLNNDYAGGDQYHHETHVDRGPYDLSEAAEILREYSRYEETDKGLWESLQPEEAISAKAAYTYGNAVYSMWQDLIKAINNAFSEELEEKFSDLDEQVLDDDWADILTDAVVLEWKKKKLKHLIEDVVKEN